MSKKRKKSSGIEKFGAIVLPLYYAMAVVLVVMNVMLIMKLWG